MFPTHKSLPLSFFVLAISAPACAPHEGGQVGEEPAACRPISTEQLAADDATPLGFMVSDVLSIAEGSQELSLHWADGTSTPLHITMSFTGVASYQDREWVDGTSDLFLSAANDCPDILSLQMRVQLRTDDGALDEDFVADLEAAEVSEALMVKGLDMPTGTLSLASFAPPGNFRAYSARVKLVAQSAGIRGDIVGWAETTEGSGDDGSVSATFYDIASFGSP